MKKQRLIVKKKQRTHDRSLELYQKRTRLVLPPCPSEDASSTRLAPTIVRRLQLPLIEASLKLRTQTENQSPKSISDRYSIRQLPSGTKRERIYTDVRERVLRPRIEGELQEVHLTTIDEQLERMQWYLKRSLEAKAEEGKHKGYLLHLRSRQALI